MPDIKVKGYSGNEIEYSNVPKVWLSAQESTEETPVLVPFTYGEAVSKTVEELDFSEGDMSVDIAEGELVTELTIKPPENLTPENIPDGMYIAGVGPGTFAGGGGSGGSVGSGDYLVRVIDYDGTILKLNYLNEGEVFTLPDAPTHEGLVFDGWSSPVDITDNSITVENCDITIGPMYHTASGATEIDVVLTKVTGLTFTFNSKLYNYTSINWGDGTSGTGLAHAYSAYGKYTIKIYGMTRVDNGSSTTGGIVATSSYFQIVAVRLSASITGLGQYAFYGCKGLSSITFPKGMTWLYDFAFNYCYGLNTIILPSSINDVDTYVFAHCYALRTVVIPKGLTVAASYFFQYAYKLDNVTIPNSLKYISSYMFRYCYGLTRIVLPDSVTIIYSYGFNNCYGLTEVVFSSAIKTIQSYAFGNCYSLIKYDFTACTSVPSLSGSLSNINNACQILVPASLYDTWIAATNWSTYANYIVAV